MDNREKESKKILERVANESEQIGKSSMSRVAGKYSEDSGSDKIEELGTKIGRGLGMVAVVVLAVYLFNTYLMPT